MWRYPLGPPCIVNDILAICVLNVSESSSHNKGAIAAKLSPIVSAASIKSGNQCFLTLMSGSIDTKYLYLLFFVIS